MKIKKETAIKILCAMLTVVMLVGCMQSTIFASNINLDTITNATPNSGTENAEKAVAGAANGILRIVQIIAMAVAIIMLIVLAIKYISSAPNDKAQIKQHAVVYVVGAVLLFGASGILGLVQNFAGSAFGDGTSSTSAPRGN